MNFTTNYNLQKPLYTERYDINVHNTNMDMIDAEMLNQKRNIEKNEGSLNELSLNLKSHVDNKSNPHNITKNQVGLGNVENKSSATIRNEMDYDNVVNALGYTPFDERNAFSKDYNDLINKPYIPRNTSDLINDSDFITINDVVMPTIPNKTSELINDAGFITIKDVNIPAIPSKTSELVNDSGFITIKDVDSSQNHMHTNKSVLDKITQSTLDKISELENRVGNIDLLLDRINRTEV